MQANDLSTAEWIAVCTARVAQLRQQLAATKHWWQRDTIKQQIRMHEGWIAEMQVQA